MLNIASVLKFIRDGVRDGVERYVVVDDEHIIDNDTGVKLHIYEDWFKVTHNDAVLATMRDFDTNIEQPIIWEIKALITDADVMEQRKQDYMKDIKERREKFSYRLEYPEPLKSKSVVMESETEEYTG